MKEYKVVIWGERFELYPAADEILCSAWPEFMLNNKNVNEHWDTFVEEFKDIQLMLMDGEEMQAIINTQTIQIDFPLDELPDGGWAGLSLFGGIFGEGRAQSDSSKHRTG
ncbi:hypothetical protein MLD52_16235 [Puniceicoccaceae bacterium K14]|nr:hypothetical protein [Puniceicoccaceae bacterium K14]